MLFDFGCDGCPSAPAGRPDLVQVTVLVVAAGFSLRPKETPAARLLLECRELGRAGRRSWKAEGRNHQAGKPLRPSPTRPSHPPHLRRRG